MLAALKIKLELGKTSQTCLSSKAALNKVTPYHLRFLILLLNIIFYQLLGYNWKQQTKCRKQIQLLRKSCQEYRTQNLRGENKIYIHYTRNNRIRDKVGCSIRIDEFNFERVINFKYHIKMPMTMTNQTTLAVEYKLKTNAFMLLTIP